MPRFYFHLHNSTGLTPDEEGRELKSLAEARESAMEDIRSVLCGDVEQGFIDMRGRIEIADADGEALMTVDFSEAVDLRVEGHPA
jgi:hypothetical protein